MSRTIVITGGTSGIGLALKELFEKNGDTVLTFSIDEAASTNHYQGSVSHEIKVNQVFNDIHEKHGSIDMLINCAGFGMSAITEIAPMEKIRDLVDVNFFGTIYCTRAALRYMSAGARIVNLSSAMALFPVPFKSIYGAAKSAVLSLSMSMKMELAPAGIDVVAICPGDTKTNFSKNRIKEFETTERYGDRLKTAMEHHDAKESKRMPVDFVANQIFKIVNKKTTKPFYIVGGKYKFLYFLTRLTPKSLLINMTGKKLGGRMEAVPTKAPVARPVSEPVQETPSYQETTTFATMTAETVEPTEEVATTEPMPEAHAEITQEEAKNNISNILNKITILNRPGEQKAAAEETNENETVVSTTDNFTVEDTAIDTVATTTEETIASPAVEEPVVEEPTTVTFEEETPAPAQTVDTIPAVEPVDVQPATVVEPVAPQPAVQTEYPEFTPVVPTTPAVPVQPTTPVVEEPVTSNIQFDEE